MKSTRKGLIDMLDTHVDEALDEPKAISNQGSSSQLQENQDKDKMKKVKNQKVLSIQLLLATLEKPKDLILLSYQCSNYSLMINKSSQTQNT